MKSATAELLKVRGDNEATDDSDGYCQPLGVVKMNVHYQDIGHFYALHCKNLSSIQSLLVVRYLNRFHTVAGSG